MAQSSACPVKGGTSFAIVSRPDKLRARWTEAGRVIHLTRNVTEEPGGRISVDFTRPPAK